MCIALTLFRRSGHESDNRIRDHFNFGFWNRNEVDINLAEADGLAYVKVLFSFFLYFLLMGGSLPDTQLLVLVPLEGKSLCRDE